MAQSDSTFATSSSRYVITSSWPFKDSQTEEVGLANGKFNAWGKPILTVQMCLSVSLSNSFYPSSFINTNFPCVICPQCIDNFALIKRLFICRIFHCLTCELQQIVPWSSWLQRAEGSCPDIPQWRCPSQRIAHTFQRDLQAKSSIHWCTDFIMIKASKSMVTWTYFKGVIGALAVFGVLGHVDLVGIPMSTSGAAYWVIGLHVAK